jgi:hypothetical protein
VSTGEDSPQGEPGPLDWLQTQVVTDLKLARRMAAGEPREAHFREDASDPGMRDVLGFLQAHGPQWVIDDCEAKLAIIGLCEAQLPVDAEYDGRDPDEIMRDEALAELADDILALLADGYRHRDGWAGHWACPACGVALHDLPGGHSWAIPLEGGPWTCRDLGKVSPAEFTAGPTPGSPPGSGSLSGPATGSCARSWQQPAATCRSSCSPRH